METMLAHLFSQLFVISIQIILLLLFILLVFKVRPSHASYTVKHKHTLQMTQQFIGILEMGL